MSAVDGRYASLAGMCAKFGQPNIRAYSDIARNNTEDDSRESSAMAWADAFVDSELRVRGYITPVPATSRDILIVNDLASLLAGLWLYDSWPGRDPKDDDWKAQRLFAANLFERFDQAGGLDCPRIAQDEPPNTFVTIPIVRDSDTPNPFSLFLR